MGGILSTKPPATPPIPPPAPMPDVDDEKVRRAGVKAKQRSAARSGRSSTILTDFGNQRSVEKFGSGK